MNESRALAMVMICAVCYALLIGVAHGEQAAEPSTGVNTVVLHPGETISVSCEAEEPEPPDPGGDPYVYQIDGLVHQPTLSNPVRRIEWAPPPGLYERIGMRVSVDIDGSAWLGGSKRYGLAWYVIDARNRDMLGYGFANRNQVTFRQGIGMAQGDKSKDRVSYALDGKYDLWILYNAGGGYSTMLIMASGSMDPVVTLASDKAIVSPVEIKPGEKLTVDLGFPGTSADEPASLNMTYSDLLMQVFPEVEP